MLIRSTAFLQVQSLVVHLGILVLQSTSADEPQSYDAKEPSLNAANRETDIWEWNNSGFDSSGPHDRTILGCTSASERCSRNLSPKLNVWVLSSCSIRCRDLENNHYQIQIEMLNSNKKPRISY
jgi:hypothetical protein